MTGAMIPGNEPPRFDAGRLCVASIFLPSFSHGGCMIDLNPYCHRLWTDVEYAFENPETKVIHHMYDIDAFTPLCIETGCNIETLLLHGLASTLKSLGYSTPIMMYLRTQGDVLRLSHLCLGTQLRGSWMHTLPGYLHSEEGTLGKHCLLYASWDGAWLTRHHALPRAWRSGYPFLFGFNHDMGHFTYGIFQVAHWRARAVLDARVRFLRYDVLLKRMFTHHCVRGDSVSVRQAVTGLQLRASLPDIPSVIGGFAWATLLDASRLVCLYLDPLASFAFNEDGELGSMYRAEVRADTIEDVLLRMEQPGSLLPFIESLYQYFRLIEQHDIALMVLAQLVRIKAVLPEDQSRHQRIDGATLGLLQRYGAMGSALGLGSYGPPQVDKVAAESKPDPYQFRADNADRLLRLVPTPPLERQCIIAEVHHMLRHREIARMLHERRN